jgi:hypothetical protein
MSRCDVSRKGVVTQHKLCVGAFGKASQERLRDATEADELIVTTITHDHHDRVRSYQLLAEEWARR